jgi:uncharacterized protein
MRRKPRVVVDTNVFISAFLFGGKPEAVLDVIHAGAFALVFSAPLQREVDRILHEKSGWTPDQRQRACDRFWENGLLVVPRARIDACVDPDDNRILECAVEGQAQFIVTGDKDLLRMQSFRGIAIVTPAEFLDRLSGRRNPEP